MSIHLDMTRPRTTNPPCPCDSGDAFNACCGRLLSGQVTAATALVLMRSRYAAYTLGDAAYLLATWHPSTRPTSLEHDVGNQPKWIGLTIRNHRQRDPDHAVVEFIARYRIQGRAQRLHETSRFVREDGLWFYVDGDLHD